MITEISKGSEEALITHFVNLTNGIEAIPEIKGEVGFIRIQSTACEQNRWEFIIQELDYTFLMAIALGYTVYVYDYSARKEIPRALYKGLEFVRYVLNRDWLQQSVDVNVNGHNSKDYFEEVYRSFRKRTKKKIKYFRKFLKTDTIDIVMVTDFTEHDGDYDYYRRVLIEQKGHFGQKGLNS